ncbi:DUF427 domain-containing protein [Mesorhizobium sp. CAU 1741]|uniref:DUF427 domain-containing protein n=1 Tax=Mesorhizobium sp. CAU 1741 TaxID=3140366 RepID=UPI00325AD7A1
MSNPSPGMVSHPDRIITVEPFPGTVSVRFGDVVIASSTKALELREGSYPPVFYIPFEDIYFEHLERSDSQTYCQFKGDASYWGVSAQGEAAPDAMWAYQTPYDEMQPIKDHGAFDRSKVTIDAG